MSVARSSGAWRGYRLVLDYGSAARPLSDSICVQIVAANADLSAKSIRSAPILERRPDTNPQKGAPFINFLTSARVSALGTE